MARKSRKQNNATNSLPKKPSLVQTAVYVRLSLEERSKKGNSIENQQRLISNYIDEHAKFELYDTYIDSGVSGATFERPNFQRMLRDAEAGNIKCIIIKDLSRLGRNAIDTGYYVEKLFPALGVRLIAITDNFDSESYDGNITMPLTNLLNEIYALDIGRKTKSQKRQAMREGVYVGGIPPYGYMRSPDNKHKLILDTFAAKKVRQIFAWAADNISVFEIARKLNSLSIPSPMVYYSITNSASGEHEAMTSLWHPRTVKRILENEVYLGRLTQGKTKKIGISRKTAPINEWISVDETHEAIVSVEIFQAVQSIKAKSQEGIPDRPVATYSVNIFRGKIYCAHCGGHLERRKKHGKYAYHCIANRIAPNSCVGNRIGEDDVRFAVMEQVFRYRDVLSEETRHTPPDSADAIHELKFIEMELSYVQEVARDLYENLVNGVLDRTEYRELKSVYQEKLDSLSQRADELKRKLDEEKLRKVSLQKTLSVLDELADTRVLDQAHVENLIESIRVSRDGRVFVGMRAFEYALRNL